MRHIPTITHQFLGCETYVFPNGYDVSVIKDPRRPLRFEAAIGNTETGDIDYGTDLIGPGGVKPGLTSAEVEELLDQVAELSPRWAKNIR